MTTNNDPHALFFSGGKDSMLALDRSIRGGRNVAALVTLYDDASQRIRFHGVPIDLMRAQAEALGIPIALYATTPSTFEQVYLTALADLRSDGIHGLIFENIHLAEVRAWYEERVRPAGLDHLEPLWGGRRRHWRRKLSNEGTKRSSPAPRTRLLTNIGLVSGSMRLC
ncbi:MAG TPA: hypothetical protein VF792_06200 [Ktedonobacterales bacterium]